jgi:hypothetical protein
VFVPNRDAILVDNRVVIPFTSIKEMVVEEPEVIETLDTPQVVLCKEKWLKFSETQKFSSQEQMQNTYDNFMTSCVGQGQK